MRSRRLRNLLAGAACLLGLAAPVAEAVAAGPAGSLHGLRSRLDQLRPIQLIQAQDEGRLARFEVRLGQLEEELRKLTGRIEQLEYGQRALGERIDELVRDLDQRLLALDGAAGADKSRDTAALRPAAISSHFRRKGFCAS